MCTFDFGGRVANVKGDLAFSEKMAFCDAVEEMAFIRGSWNEIAFDAAALVYALVFYTDLKTDGVSVDELCRIAETEGWLGVLTEHTTFGELRGCAEDVCFDRREREKNPWAKVCGALAGMLEAPAQNGESAARLGELLGKIKNISESDILNGVIAHGG